MKSIDHTRAALAEPVAATLVAVACLGWAGPALAAEPASPTDTTTSSSIRPGSVESRVDDASGEPSPDVLVNVPGPRQPGRHFRIAIRSSGTVGLDVTQVAQR